LYGFGASAHVTIQVARHWGCKVYVFTRSEEHQRHALELGAAWVGQAQDTPPAELDSAITFAPAGWLVPEALRVLRKGGTPTEIPVHTDVELYALSEANTVLQRLKRSEIQGAAVLQIR
jgi:propanol-preferring alcohol dehydrogenase